VAKIAYGDTFKAVCTYRDSSGVLVNLTTAQITPSASIMQSDRFTLLPTISVTTTISDQTATPGEFVITSDSSLWPKQLGKWYLTIHYTDFNGNRTSEDAIEFEVV
jgi:hypothetical protein